MKKTKEMEKGKKKEKNPCEKFWILKWDGRLVCLYIAWEERRKELAM